PEILTELEREQVLARVAGGADPVYAFRNPLVHEVTYNLMSFSQRRQLHRAVAEWYELTACAENGPPLGVLAFHWKRAQAMDRFRDVAGKAGTQALLEGAYPEASSLFEELLEIPSEQGTVGALRRAAWERHLGEARLGQGLLGQARAAFSRALANCNCFD